MSIRIQAERTLDQNNGQIWQAEYEHGQTD